MILGLIIPTSGFLIALLVLFLLQKRTKGKNAPIVLRCIGLALSMVFLTVSTRLGMSPMISLAASGCLCWLLWKQLAPNPVVQKSRPLSESIRRWRWRQISLVSAIILMALWGIEATPSVLRMSLTLPLICSLCGGLMAQFIRLRAWVMTGLMACTLLGSFNIEAIFSPPAAAATENFAAGAYIIDMGQATQTIGNGLKPYGLVYDLVAKQAIPVKWAIDPAKVRDGADFSASGKTYNGGTFIISAEYAAAAATTVATWKAQGVVVDGPLSTGFSAPIYTTITSFPNTVLDFANGSIAQAYLTNAGIPVSITGTYGTSNTYRFAYPSGLNACDDVFVMPHADPTWATHSNLINFVQNQRGFLWAACHAVSVTERLDDPGDADTLPDMNFLSHVPPSITDTKSLKLFGSHAAPTVGPYQYANNTSGVLPYGYGTTNLWAYPIMQFLGKIDLATQNGSEQIYIPDVGAQWRDTTAIATYDQSNTDAVVVGTATPPISQIKAAKMAFGPGFGNSNSGIVMYEAGHSHAKATGPDNIAAQRALLNFILLAGVVRGMNVNITPNPLPTTVVAGTTVTNLQASVTGGSGTYSYKWYSSCGGTFSNPTGATTNFTAPATVAQNTSCSIRVIITDSCNRRSFGSSTTTITPAPALPKPVDLDVFKTDNQATVFTGALVVYTVSVKNNGPNSISSFSFSDTANVTNNGSNNSNLAFPSGLTITPSSGTYSSGTWTGSTPLAIGQTVIFTVTGTVSSVSGINTTDPASPTLDPDQLINTATVTVPTGFTDTNAANNSSQDIDSIQAQVVDIAVTKNDGVTNVFKDQGIAYTITVTNKGNVPIAGIQLVDQAYRKTGTVTNPSTGNSSKPSASGGNDAFYGTIDRGIFKGAPSTTSNSLDISNVSKGAVYNTSNTAVTQITLQTGAPTPYNWTGLNLAPGESATLTLSAQNQQDTGDSYIANVISVSPLNGSNGLLTDATPSDNTYYDVDKIIAKPSGSQNVDLSVTKSYILTSPKPGDTITYTVTAKNLDTGSNAASALFSDIIPLSITNVSWSCAVTNVGATSSATNCGTSVSGTGNTISTTINLSKSNSSNITTLTYTINGTIDASATGTVNNTATIQPRSADSDVNPSNNSSTASFTLPTLYKLDISKTDGLAAANLGNSVTYTITVANKGSTPVTALKLVDDLAQGYLLNPVYTPSTGSYVSATGDWTGLNLQPNNSATLQIQGTVSSSTPTGTGTLVNTATLTVPSGIILLNNSGSTVASLTAQDIDNVNPTADLSVTKTDDQTIAIPGQSIGYTMTVSNSGPSIVTSLMLNDAVPAAILNPIFTPSDGIYNSNTGLWSGLNLDAGQSITLILQGTVSSTATGNLTNTVTVFPPSGIIDPNCSGLPTVCSGNNTATDTDMLQPQADLSITKTDARATVNPNDSISYTLRVTNNGPSAANGVTVTDFVPVDLIAPNSPDANYSLSANTATWTGINLSPGQVINLTLTGTVSASIPNPGNLTNTATIIIPASVSDPNPNNNTSIDIDKVPVPSGSVDLQITKDDGQTVAMPGDPLTYTITVTNVSGGTVDSVKVTDLLPSTLLDPVFSTPYGTYDSVTGDWTGLNLVAGESILLIVDSTVSASATGNITNTVTVIPPAGFTDPNCTGTPLSCNGNNIATDIDTIPSVNHAEVLLVKRITAINGLTTNPNDGTVLNTFVDNTTSEDNATNWPASYLLGAIDAGKVEPNNDIEYTVYFLNSGGSNASNVWLCDRIVGEQTYIPGSMRLKLGNDPGVLEIPLTDANDNLDRAEEIPGGAAVPTVCNLKGVNDRGTVVIGVTGTNGSPNLSTLLNSTGQGTPLDSFGYIRFKTKVNP
jgi:uncharacterized repeat protein (TIGR01451 family)